MHIIIILNNSRESIIIADVISTLFFCLSDPLRYLRPSVTDQNTIIAISSVTNVRCCHEKYPSASLVYPPKPKNSFNICMIITN